MTDHGETRFRPDIHALRALAVSAVVAFHAGVPHVRGGFVGVDVFFVISGFLITSQLLREKSETGTISFAGFYARRIRRLLPLSTFVLLCIVVASAILLLPFTLSSVAADAGWAAAYLANFRFASTGENYFAIVPSPVVHYWSLAVEEQFYVFWPLILLVLLKKRKWLLPAVAILAFVSFLQGCISSYSHPTFAYYSTTGRAWQLLAGALVAIALPTGIPRLRSMARAAVAIAGAAVLLASVVAVDETDAYPGIVAVFPVAGAVLVLLAAPTAGGPLGKLMSLRPVRFIGDVSYGWYLWHWPFIIFAELLVANDGKVRVAAALLALVAAWITYHLVEQPFRRGRLLRVPIRAAVAAAVAAGVVVASSTAVYAFNEHRLAQPRLAELRSALFAPLPVGDDCFSPDVDALLKSCRGGTPGGPRIVLAGDSNARMWYPAFDSLGKRMGFEVVLYAGNGCNVLGFDSEVLVKDCRTYSRGIDSVFRQLKPAAVVITHFASDRMSRQGQTWNSRLREFITAREQQGASVGSIDNVPAADFSVPECLLDHESASSCSLNPRTALVGPRAWRDFQQSAFDSLNVRQIAPSSFLCRPTVCPMRAPSGQIIYQDGDHVTVSYARAAAPRFRRFVESLLNSTSPPP